MKLIDIYETIDNDNIVINDINELTNFIESVDLLMIYNITIISKLSGRVNVALRMTSSNRPSRMVAPDDWWKDLDKRTTDSQCYYIYTVSMEGKPEKTFYSGTYSNIKEYKKISLAKKALIKELQYYLN